jgi:hypothetical protein
MPAAVAITRKEHTATELRRAATRTKDADAARRMLALAHVMDGKSRVARLPPRAAWTARRCATGCTATMPKD